MTAATTSDNRVLANHRRKIESALRNAQDENVAIVHGTCTPQIFCDSYTIATTALDDEDDFRRLYLFPDGAIITDLRATVTDGDGNATPTLVFSLVTTSSSDVVADVLVSESTAGQAGGTVRIADAGVGQYVGGKYLAWRTDTVAATPAAVTLGLYVAYALGCHNYATGINPRMTDPGV